MIVFDTPRIIKHEKGKVYLKSRGMNKNCGIFCDYSKTENLVEIEEPSGERWWIDIAPFFRGYKISVGKCIGVVIGTNVKTYQIRSIENRKVRGCSYLYALLISLDTERQLDISKDYPLNKEEHDLTMPFGNKVGLPF